MTARIDIVTVFHNDRNYQEHLKLRDALLHHEPEGGYTFITVDNRVNNRGFAGGCNAGAFTDGAEAPIIGFLNPDATIKGPFLDRVEETLTGATVITGCRYGKAQFELDTWGVTDWVCGAAMFVTRAFFTSTGGFDRQFVWAWEETDLIRQAQAQGRQCRSITLPIIHASPDDDNVADANYKRYHFNRGAQRYHAKWAQPRSAGGFARRRP